MPECVGDLPLLTPRVLVALVVAGEQEDHSYVPLPYPRPLLTTRSRAAVPTGPSPLTGL